MALEVGTKLGRYEIRSQLGVGGMGEVYLAHDTTVLERTVAIKVLPAAALNHPNIAHIYEIDEAAGHHSPTASLLTSARCLRLMASGWFSVHGGPGNRGRGRFDRTERR